MTALNELCDTISRWLTESTPQDPGWSAETWAQFQFVSLVLGVGPLLQPKLAQADWIEPEAKAWLAQQYDFNSRRLAKIHAELKAILACFEAHEVGVMPLKGAILAAAYYSEPGLRPMADIDLLIRPADFERSSALLQQLGYEPELAHWKHTEFSKPDNRTIASRTSEHPDNPRRVELHLHCRENFGGPVVDLTAAMWQTASTGSLLGEAAMLPSVDMLWLHVLLHAGYHIWQGKGRLIYLVDLAQLWPHLTDPAAALGRVDARYTYPALSLLKRCFPQMVSDQLLAVQAAKLSAPFRRWAEGLDLVTASYLNPAPPGLYLTKALRFTEGRPNEVLQVLRFSLLPDLTELSLDHPRLARSKLPWLAYLLLPLDWLKRLVLPTRKAHSPKS
jgi:hypothetical protein